ncbi:hypothetical protein NC651_017974 [Populus alba x Populus x berolinensis]|nr:hypothetical protein NC651_017974 [Populus alba x Populus x berolinensis]
MFFSFFHCPFFVFHPSSVFYSFRDLPPCFLLRFLASSSPLPLVVPLLLGFSLLLFFFHCVLCSVFSAFFFCSWLCFLFDFSAGMKAMAEPVLLSVSVFCVLGLSSPVFHSDPPLPLIFGPRFMLGFFFCRDEDHPASSSLCCPSLLKGQRSSKTVSSTTAIVAEDMVTIWIGCTVIFLLNRLPWRNGRDDEQYCKRHR